MRVEAGLHYQVQSVTVVTNSTAATGTAVGATKVRALLGQRDRVIMLKAFDTGPSSGSLSIIAQGSIDGTVWVNLGTALTTASTDAVTASRLEVVSATPWVRLFITTQGSPAYQMSMDVTE